MEDLSHLTATSSAGNCIAKQPATPVVIHWQLHDFPIRLAQVLLKQERSIVWVVATTERGDIAEREFAKAGISVRRVQSLSE
jgi:hypothetical protein